MERFFDYVWRGVVGMTLFVLVLPILAFLAGEMPGGDLNFYGRAVLNGVTRGCVYGLVALGLTLIYRTQRLVNFAQGEIVTLGFFVMVTTPIVLGSGYWMSVGLTIVLVAVIAMASGFVVNALARKSLLYALMATLGLGLLISVLTDELVQGYSGAVDLTTPFSGRNVTIGSVILSSQSLAVILITVSLVGVLFLVVRHSRWGVMVRTIWLQRGDRISKGSLSQISLIAWGLAGGLGAVAGILLIPVGGLGEEAHFIVFKAIPAVVLGGFGSLRGALIGGLVIGVAEAMAGLYISESAERVVAYVILLVVLIIRPYGLLGERQAVREMDGAALS